MDLMSSIIDAVAALRELPTKSAQGLAFEKLMVNFIKADPTLSGEFDEVHRWVDWPYNGGRVDTGIDLVAHNRDDGTFTAIQCKFYQPSTSLAKGQLDSFFEASGRTFDTPEGTRTFSNRLIISTTDKWSANAEEMLANQTIPTSSTLLGVSGAVAIRAVPQQGDDGGLDAGEHGVETQPADRAFGPSTSLFIVTNRCAAVTRVTWWCQPSQCRPSK